MHYRDLTVWQRAMEAAREIYRLVPLLPREETFGMRSQITRAAVSIPANIAEGWARESPRDTAHFFAIAHGSLAETETLLTLCKDLGWFATPGTSTVRDLLDETSRMLTTMRRRYRDDGKEPRAWSR
ncbi:MAG: four helix bundle protein [Thermomicrobiales bacterium]